MTKINLTLCRMNAYQRWWLRLPIFVHRICLTNDSEDDHQPGPLLFQDDSDKDHLKLCKMNVSLSNMVAETVYICAQSRFYK